MKGRNRTRELYTKKINSLKEENKEMKSYINALERTVNHQEELLEKKDLMIQEIEENANKLGELCEKSIKEAHEYRDKFHRAYLEMISLKKKCSKELNDIINDAKKDVG